MNETPECPYCGAEMELHNIPDQLIPDSLWWYQCDCCGATAPSDETPAQALTAALRRVEPENRVLTLEELEEHCAKGPDAEPLWIEFREECAISRWIFAAIKPDVFDRPVLAEWIATDRRKKYKKVWRCWLRKPTAEEMGRERWEE